MTDVYLAKGLRSPFGALGGALKTRSAPQLAAPLMAALMAENQIPLNALDEVILGQVIQGGTGQAPARQALRLAKIADSTPALTINKVCGSGLKAIMLAADQIRLSEANLILAGGMESMSQAPFALPDLRWGKQYGNSEARDLLAWDALIDPYSGQPMGLLTEERIKEQSLSRAEQDDYCIQSYQRAQKAQAEGIFNEEIHPIQIPNRKGDILVTEDEEPGRVQFEKVRQLKAVFDPEGSITAANASTIDDGAAVCLIASEQALHDYHLRPMAKIIAYCQHSQSPETFSLAPIGAIEALCKKTGLTIKDIDLWEINEAFSAVPLMAAKQLGIPPERLNIWGGAVSLGHPVGASGGRLALTLAHQLQRLDKRYGIASLCIGGGEAVAMLLEKVEN